MPRIPRESHRRFLRAARILSTAQHTSEMAIRDRASLSFRVQMPRGVNISRCEEQVRACKHVISCELSERSFMYLRVIAQLSDEYDEVIELLRAWEVEDRIGWFGDW